jgi:hypothetical protein
MPWKDRTFACGPTAVPEPPGRVAVLRGSGEARRGGPGFFSGSRCFELSLQYHTSAHPSSREKKSLANEAPAAGVTACWTLCFQRRSSPAPPVSCSQRAPGAREFLIGYSGVGRAPAAVSTHRSYASSFSAASSSKSDTQSCIAGMSSSTEGHSRCSVAFHRSHRRLPPPRRRTVGPGRINFSSVHGGFRSCEGHTYRTHPCGCRANSTQYGSVIAF